MTRSAVSEAHIVQTPAEEGAALSGDPTHAVDGNREGDVEGFAALDALEFLSLQGQDKKGNAVIRIAGGAIPATTVGADLLSRYVLHFTNHLQLDLPSSQSFSVVYFHSGFHWNQNCPGVLWLQWLYHELPQHFRQRVEAVYAVHPGFRIRTGLFLLCPWLADGLYFKVSFISRLEFLEEFVDLTCEIDIPSSVLDHDKLLEEQPLSDYGFQLDKIALKAQIPDVGVHTDHNGGPHPGLHGE